MHEVRVREPGQFGQRRQNSITITSNGKTREYRVPASVLIGFVCLFFVGITGYMGATAYLMFRDGLISNSLARQARLKHEYEDRIAALRAKVDRITSRQLLDQQAVESRVADLMRQQEMLSGRNGALKTILDKARANGLAPEDTPVPTRNPKKAALGDADPLTTGSISINGNETHTSISLRGTSDALPGTNSNGISGSSNMLLASTPLNEGVFGEVLDQIGQVAMAQRDTVAALHKAARDKASQLASLMEEIHLPVPDSASSAIGGPYMAARNDMDFEDMVDELSNTLDAIEKLRKRANAAPLANPAPSAGVSSNFGNRRDPFLNKTAFHAGIDFTAPTGTRVHAAGAGKVIRAGRAGGYGNMVEVDHGYGITTRYAHLSRIGVKAGDWVGKGHVLGRVGSTGRSTGPHLHYEVRRNGKPTNPIRFLNAGKKIAKVL
jgi:murein DD-endopeptidase MepM/ murein hydrolase activator NlpD